ncbi:MAG: transcriptional repressor [Nitrospinae bacterium]|nr:transcriptional repressor [Nitrospinota bacterium]
MRLSHNEFRGQFKAKGLVLTPQRWAVYETLMGMHGHPDVDDVFGKVAEILPSISLNTVYTTLDWLEENGFAHSVLPRDSAKRYDTTNRPHHHLLCVKCGGLTDFWELYGTDIVPKKIRNQNEVLGVDVTVNILCGNCKPKPAKKSKNSRS